MCSLTNWLLFSLQGRVVPIMRPKKPFPFGLCCLILGLVVFLAGVVLASVFIYRSHFIPQVSWAYRPSNTRQTTRVTQKGRPKVNITLYLGPTSRSQRTACSTAGSSLRTRCTPHWGDGKNWRRMLASSWRTTTSKSAFPCHTLEGATLQISSTTSRG